MGAEACCPCPASQEDNASLENIKIQNLKLQFLLDVYHFCNIVKLKNHNLNHRKSGTVCSGNWKIHCLTKLSDLSLLPALY